ncbi:MAG: hypothetical protein ACLS6C_12325, partial [Clostridia bacterium]
ARKIVIEWRFHVFGFMDHPRWLIVFGKCKASTGPNHIKQNISRYKCKNTADYSNSDANGSRNIAQSKKPLPRTCNSTGDC